MENGKWLEDDSSHNLYKLSTAFLGDEEINVNPITIQFSTKTKFMKKKKRFMWN